MLQRIRVVEAFLDQPSDFIACWVRYLTRDVLAAFGGAGV